MHDFYKDDHEVAADLHMEACERLDTNPAADLSDLWAKVPESEQEGFGKALDGYRLTRDYKDDFLAVGLEFAPEGP